MAVIGDKIIIALEQRHKQLGDVMEAYKEFRRRLNELPHELATEFDKLLGQSADTGQSVLSPEAGKDDLAGKTANECVEIILTDHGGGPMHFSTIAKEALKRGYKGRAGGSDDAIESTTAKSFWAAMSRSDSLESVGNGLYQLRMTDAVANSILFGSNGESAPSKPRLTQADAAEKALEAVAVPLRIGEIIDSIVANGWFARPDGKIASRHFSNAVWAAMSRDKRFVKAGRGLWDLRTRRMSDDKPNSKESSERSPN